MQRAHSQTPTQYMAHKVHIHPVCISKPGGDAPRETPPSRDQQPRPRGHEPPRHKRQMRPQLAVLQMNVASLVESWLAMAGLGRPWLDMAGQSRPWLCYLGTLVILWCPGIDPKQNRSCYMNPPHCAHTFYSFWDLHSHIMSIPETCAPMLPNS